MKAMPSPTPPSSSDSVLSCVRISGRQPFWCSVGEVSVQVASLLSITSCAAQHELGMGMLLFFQSAGPLMPQHCNCRVTKNFLELIA